MKRGDLYRVEKPSKRDPKSFRVFVVVSRRKFIQTRHQTVICAPVTSTYLSLESEVEIGVDEGLKHESYIHCDELVSIEKAKLTNFIGSLAPQKIEELNDALKFALELK